MCNFIFLTVAVIAKPKEVKESRKSKPISDGSSRSQTPLPIIDKSKRPIVIPTIPVINAAIETPDCSDPLFTTGAGIALVAEFAIADLPQLEQ